ncbi:MAG: restriction endonuclease, partial [Anaerolineales bacterium]
PNGIVGVDKVRELYGVLASKPDISRAVLITSGHFSSDASKFARGKNLNLINGDELRGILLRYK